VLQAEHLNMLEGGIIAKLLEEKWKTFAQVSDINLLKGLYHDIFEPQSFHQSKLLGHHGHHLKIFSNLVLNFAEILAKTRRYV
jgi:hypothetical protein